jgi:hypothetical protein
MEQTEVKQQSKLVIPHLKKDICLLKNMTILEASTAGD